MKVEPIDLATELRRIAREMNEAGMSPGRQYVLSKYDSDLLRDAANELHAYEVLKRSHQPRRPQGDNDD